MSFFSPLDSQTHPLDPAGKATLGETRPPEPFVLLSSAETIIAHGRRTSLSAALGQDIGQRVAAGFARRADGPGLLVGALPFDRDRRGTLVQPETVAMLPGRVPSAALAALTPPAGAAPPWKDKTISLPNIPFYSRPTAAELPRQRQPWRPARATTS